MSTLSWALRRSLLLTSACLMSEASIGSVNTSSHSRLPNAAESAGISRASAYALVRAVDVGVSYFLYMWQLLNAAVSASAMATRVI